MTTDPRQLPFWQSNTIRDESIVCIGDGDNATATLLYEAEAIASATSAAGDVSYVEGVDYSVDRNRRTVTRRPGSAMPFVSAAAVAAADGALTHPQTVAITYTRRQAPSTTPPLRDERARLPRLMRRLHARERITLVVTGDSISEGYDASGFHDLAPFAPAYPQLVAAGLERCSAATVRLHNLATAGWTVADGLWDTERIVAPRPDLVIVAYGMNDACYATGDEFAANVSQLMARVRTDLTEVEFLLVSPMLPTPGCSWVQHERFPEYQQALHRLVADGVGLADLTAVWAWLHARKDPYALSGNGLNHPNDFGHRIYADIILAALGCYESLGPAGAGHDSRT